MAVYIFMSLSIILGIALLLDFFGMFSRSRKKVRLEIDEFSANKNSNKIYVKYTRVETHKNNTRKAA